MRQKQKNKKINKTQSWFFEINKTNKFLARLVRNKKTKLQMSQMRGNSTKVSTDI